jgi:hypothetical protein
MTFANSLGLLTSLIGGLIALLDLYLGRKDSTHETIAQIGPHIRETLRMLEQGGIVELKRDDHGAVVGIAHSSLFTRSLCEELETYLLDPVQSHQPLPNTRLKLSAFVLECRIAFVNRTVRRRSSAAPR